MPHDIDRILSAAAGGVWLIDEDKAREIVSVLALRASGERAGWDGGENAPVYAADSVKGRRGQVHVLRLHGTIMPRSGMMSQMSGGASLEQFQKAFRAAASDPSAQAIVLDVDSPGGYVDLVQETADMVYSARRADRPIVAVANTMAASAAYWIASAADELVVTPSGSVGSIGVYGMHDDLSGALEQRGIKREIIKAGPRKAEGAVGGLDDAARKHMQERISETYAQFVASVARHRAVDAAVVRADPEQADAHFGGGRAYHAKTAVRLGMADRVATFDETLMRVASGYRSRRSSLARARLNLA